MWARQSCLQSVRELQEGPLGHQIHGPEALGCAFEAGRLHRAWPGGAELLPSGLSGFYTVTSTSPGHPATKATVCWGSA